MYVNFNGVDGRFDLSRSMYVCNVCMYVCNVCSWCLRRDNKFWEHTRKKGREAGRKGHLHLSFSPFHDKLLPTHIHMYVCIYVLQTSERHLYLVKRREEKRREEKREWHLRRVAAWMGSMMWWWWAVA